MIDVMNTELPKKILRIKDFTFILPDDFEGSFEDALQSFNEYNKQHKKPSTLADIDEKYSATAALLSSKNESKACGAYGIFAFNTEIGKYELVESPNM